MPPLDYRAHLFQERVLRSVTANTRSDGRELLALAAEIPIRTETQAYPLEQANQALVDLKQDHGIYFYRITTFPNQVPGQSFSVTKRMIHLE